MKKLTYEELEDQVELWKNRYFDLIEDNSFNTMEVKKQPENLNNDEAKLKELDKRIKILEAYILPLSEAMTAAKVLLDHEDRISKLEDRCK